MKRRMGILCLGCLVLVSVFTMNAACASEPYQNAGATENFSATGSASGPGADAATWQKVFTLLFWEWKGNAIERTRDGGSIIAGDGRKYDWRTRTYSDKAILVKITAGGAMEWMKSYGTHLHNYGTSVRQTPDGGYILGVKGMDEGIVTMLLVKTDAGGVVQWQKKVGNTGMLGPLRVEATKDGGYAVLFAMTAEGKGYQAGVLKTDKNGVKSWVKTYGGPGDEIARSFRQTGDSGFIIIGDSYAGGGQIHMVRTDANGAVTWQKYIGADGVVHYACDVIQAADGCFVVSGRTGDPPGLTIFRVGPGGALKWKKTYVQDADGNAL
ncbi:MAG: hypothetical protein LUQ25_07515, partial [Methanoregulaceae archaeon]|nr:hypothetical protein [Methanoregulaceae archaeon]